MNRLPLLSGRFPGGVSFSFSIKFFPIRALLPYRLAMAVVAMAAMPLLWSCGSDDGENETVFVRMTGLEVHIDLSDQALSPYTLSVAGDYDIRWTVDAYHSAGDGTGALGDRAKRIVETERFTGQDSHSFNTFLLSEGQYTLLVWVDLVERGSRSDLHYATADLRQVTCIGPGGTFTGFDPSKDAFAAAVTTTVRPSGRLCQGVSLSIDAIRPLAAYQLIATDVDDFKEARPGVYPSVTIGEYQMFIPRGYNVQLGVAMDYRENASYTYNFDITGDEGEAVVASDYMFIGHAPAAYTLDISTYTSTDTAVSSASDIGLALVRNGMLVIRGAFLSSSAETDGIGVEDGFDDEILVPLD